MSRLSDEQYLEIAHRMASTYRHEADGPGRHHYGFQRHTLLDFARAVADAAVQAEREGQEPVARVELTDTQMLDFIETVGCDWDGIGAYINMKSYKGETLRDCIRMAMEPVAVELTDAEVDALYVQCHAGLTIDRHKFAKLIIAAHEAKKRGAA